ncbi:hypothetical protein V5799_008879, partial [Amblyomma americanum]
MGCQAWLLGKAITKNGVRFRNFKFCCAYGPEADIVFGVLDCLKDTLTDLSIDCNEVMCDTGTQALAKLLRDSLILENVKLDFPSTPDTSLVLLQGLAESRSVSSLTLSDCVIGGTDDVVPIAFEDLLRVNSSIVTLTVVQGDLGELKVFLKRLAAGLAENHSISELNILHGPDCLEGVPNYDLVRKRDAYLREQGKLRAKIDDFFHRTEARMKLDREALSYQYAADTSPPHIYPRERPPAATVYQEFCPLTVPKEGQHPVHTVTDSSNVGSRDKVEAAVQAAEIRRHQSNELFNFPKDAYCPAKDMTGSYDSSHGDEVIERATQTKPRPRRLAGKPRVKFALNARDTAPSKSADLAENVLETVIQFLSTEDLLICRRVCRAWKRIVERPHHWLHIDLNHTSVSAE